MTNKSKQKGTKAETKVVKYLKSKGIKAERKALSGSQDQGDISVYDGEWILEVKAGQQTANPSRSDLKEWMRQTTVEAKNANAKYAALVVVRYRRSIEDADVYIVKRGLYHRAPTFCWLDQLADEWIAH